MQGMSERGAIHKNCWGECATRSRPMIDNHSFLFNSFIAIITNNENIIARRTIKLSPSWETLCHGPIYLTLLLFINAFKSSRINFLHFLIETCTPHLCMLLGQLLASHRFSKFHVTLINYSLVLIDYSINFAC